MAGAFSTIVLRRSDGSTFPQRVWDESGTGAGPFQPVNIIATVAGIEFDPATAALQVAGNASVASIDTKMTTLAGYVDGLEALATSLNGYVDGLETLIGTSNTSLSQIHTDLATTLAAYVDGLETLVTSSNTKLDTLHTDLATTLAGYVDGLETLATATNAALAAATPAGANLIGRAVADASAATGGISSTSRILSAAGSTNATSAKGSVGRLYAIHGYNAAASVRYLKLYNKATAPTVGTDTPVKTLALPPSCGFAFDWPHGYSFATGIAYALTTGSADADTGALTAADVLGLNVDYV